MPWLMLWGLIACGTEVVPGDTARVDVVPVADELCDNGLDDDVNGRIDCDDPACDSACHELCIGGVDEDQDGLVDCEDPSCDGSCVEDCTDGRDNDGDGGPDCLDSDCDGGCAEDCRDGRDNDGDGGADCGDSDCDGGCPETCGDGRDNDGDSLIDCLDSECDGSCPEDCLDVRDNDGDGAYDCDDSDCDGGCPEDCLDGRDNDGDGTADCLDVECDGGCPEVCDDGRDNDGDGSTDCTDSNCDGGCPETCTDSRDNDGDGAYDCLDTDCDGSCVEVCADDRDNDGDGDFDCVDEDCDGGCPEDCLDARDNDGDAATDCDDSDCDGGCPEDCSDGRDNDGDLSTDCLDGDCDGDCPEVCTDTRDNDGDGDVDCDDSNCDSTCDSDGDGFLAEAFGGDDCDDSNPDAFPGGDEVCDLGADNDCDGLADEDDPSVDPSTRDAVYLDSDGDGFGVGLPLFRCEPPPGYGPDDGDCNEGNPAVNPGAQEICNGGVDDDCDLLADDIDPSVDPDSALTWFRDADGDGLGDPLITQVKCVKPAGWVANDDDCNDTTGGIGAAVSYVVDNDFDGYGVGDLLEPTCDPPAAGEAFPSAGVDCDDSNAGVNPGIREVCNAGVDDDCDGLVDLSDASLDPATLTTWYRDDDFDGFGDPNDWSKSCDPLDGYVLDLSDCDDGDPDVNLFAVEVCNGRVDDDCDSLLDDGDPSLDLATQSTFWEDGDHDGFGDALVFTDACAAPFGFVANPDDCDDADPSELGAVSWLYDDDGDGFGAGLPTAALCARPGVKYVEESRGFDCDDSNPVVAPDALEICDTFDNDCDSLVDDADPSRDPALGVTSYDDIDGDGFGNVAASEAECVADAGEVLVSGDCNDVNPAINPVAVERCNLLVDDDCDGLRDDADPSLDPASESLWFQDNDGDGFGRAGSSTSACLGPVGSVSNDDDCADNDAAKGPPLQWEEDFDGDGFTAGGLTGPLCDPPDVTFIEPSGELDCDDLDVDAFPDAPEVCEDGVDQNCDGVDIICVFCSALAEQLCVDKGWFVAVGGEAENGNLVCTIDGGPASDNCRTCANYNVYVWDDASTERECDPFDNGLSLGNVYGGHQPCACVGAMALCETWDLQDCVPD